jgi:outer membrane protein assembly factor BamB
MELAFQAARRGLLQCFNVARGRPEPAWTFQMPHEVPGSPAVEADCPAPLVFLGSKYGNLVAIDALTGRERWQQMAGNWIDNSACIGRLDGRNIVLVGSHDYCVYAFEANDGTLLWKRLLGGEVFSAPAFFRVGGEHLVAAASLDNHLYVLNARDGAILASFFTGTPIWDKVPKGEVLWGSPAVVAAGAQTVIVYGSFNDVVYTLPVAKECSLAALARSGASLWWSLLAVLIIFAGIVVPAAVMLPRGDRARR